MYSEYVVNFLPELLIYPTFRLQIPPCPLYYSGKLWYYFELILGHCRTKTPTTPWRSQIGRNSIKCLRLLGLTFQRALLCCPTCEAVSNIDINSALLLSADNGVHFRNRTGDGNSRRIIKKT
jgi:hypothetical protein